MRLATWIRREMAFRKANFALAVLAVALATAGAAGVAVALRAYDAQTRALLEGKERDARQAVDALAEDMRKTTLKLSFNLLILPKAQSLADWHTRDYGEALMPEAYAEKLAASGLVSIQHILPTLQRKILWPERKRTVILVGTRGEIAPGGRGGKKPLIEPVPRGTLVLGHELHRSLGIRAGDEVTLLGRAFRVHRCHEQRGNKDDLTAWLHLAEAQELLDLKGRINAILALECICAAPDGILAKVREELAATLPDTQVVERGTAALARAEARVRVGREAQESVERERRAREALRLRFEGVAAVLLPLVWVGCAVWIALLAHGNVSERRAEIGLLVAIGWPRRRVLGLFLGKLAAVGLTGGALGVAAVAVVARVWPVAGAQPDARLALATLGGAVALALVAGWLPVFKASLQDPANTLRGHEG